MTRGKTLTEQMRDIEAKRARMTNRKVHLIARWSGKPEDERPICGAAPGPNLTINRRWLALATDACAECLKNSTPEEPYFRAPFRPASKR